MRDFFVQLNLGPASATRDDLHASSGGREADHQLNALPGVLNLEVGASTSAATSNDQLRLDPTTEARDAHDEQHALPRIFQ